MKKSTFAPVTMGENMRRWRKIRGYSIGELSDLSNVSEGSIQMYELGACTPGSERLIRLADALEVPLDVYVGRRTAGGDKEEVVMLLQEIKNRLEGME